MRSPAESPRIRPRLERAGRWIGLGALGALLALALFAGGGSPLERAGPENLGAALIRWSREDPPAAAHIRVAANLPPHARDWLGALLGAGTAVSWSGAPPVPTALSADPVADPRGATSARLALPPGAPAVLSDPLGVLDSIPDSSGGAGFLVSTRPRFLATTVRGTTARSSPADSLELGRILLLGRVGWESKFIVVALEERGWQVDAELVLAPKQTVRQGAWAPLDTSRYAAVIVLDTTQVDPRPIAAFVRSGGGLVLSAAAARGSGYQAIGAGFPGASLPAPLEFDTGAALPRNSLELSPLLPGPGALPLERRGALVAVAARRIERGRVLTLGYDDTWRWRLGGGGEAAAAHRSWWAGLVAQVAHVRRVRLPLVRTSDEAPLASLVDRLGAATPPPAALPIGNARWRSWLLALALGGLLLEWGSRRLRGAR